jgi:hypothetical protein
MKDYDLSVENRLSREFGERVDDFGIAFRRVG